MSEDPNIPTRAEAAAHASRAAGLATHAESRPETTCVNLMEQLRKEISLNVLLEEKINRLNVKIAEVQEHGRQLEMALEQSEKENQLLKQELADIKKQNTDNNDADTATPRKYVKIYFTKLDGDESFPDIMNAVKTSSKITKSMLLYIHLAHSKRNATICDPGLQVMVCEFQEEGMARNVKEYLKNGNWSKRICLVQTTDLPLAEGSTRIFP